MSKMVDLVVVRLDSGAKHLYRAPYCKLKADDEVIVESFGDEVERGIVIWPFRVLDDSDTAEGLIRCFNAAEPLQRVISHVEYHVFVYHDEEEKNGNN